MPVCVSVSISFQCVLLIAVSTYYELAYRVDSKTLVNSFTFLVVCRLSFYCRTLSLFACLLFFEVFFEVTEFNVTVSVCSHFIVCSCYRLYYDMFTG